MTVRIMCLGVHRRHWMIVSSFLLVMAMRLYSSVRQMMNAMSGLDSFAQHFVLTPNVNNVCIDHQSDENKLN